MKIPENIAHDQQILATDGGRLGAKVRAALICRLGEKILLTEAASLLGRWQQALQTGRGVRIEELARSHAMADSPGHEEL